MKQALENAGINENFVIENWGKNPDIEENILNICRERILRSEDLSVKDPIFGKMRSLVERDLDNMLGIYYRPPVYLLDGTAASKMALKNTSDSHRRAATEPKEKNLSQNISANKSVISGRNRSSSVLSFEAMQHKLSGLATRLRQPSEISVRSDNSPIKPQPTS